MPIYMDRHDLPESVNAEEVARLHQADLKIEDEYGCKGLTYWFDGQRNTAFCLIKAPNKKALQDMHKHAHGDVPNSIIEVDPDVVESFLGRIEDPAKATNSELNVIDDPAFRILMMVSLRNNDLSLLKDESHQKRVTRFRNELNASVKRFDGRVVPNEEHRCLMSFASVSGAVNCAEEVKKSFNSVFNAVKSNVELHIGISSGVPFDQPDGLFKGTVRLADRLCHVVQGGIVTSSEVRDLFASENLNLGHEDRQVRGLSPAEEGFLNAFMDFTEDAWNRANLKVEDFSQNLGLSKAQLYRKVKSLTGRSLNSFVKHYRLEKAMQLLSKKKGNVSEIAFDTGFNSPAYFTKCFFSAYGVLPSEIFR